MLKARKKNKVDNCESCGKEFHHYSWDNQKYCSKSCAWNKLKIEVSCIICGTSIKKSKSQVDRNNSNYCSRECYNKRSVGLKRLKRSTAYWQNLLDSSSCGCGESRKYLLQIHHIDGNHKNNSKDNLEIVCPTCHVKRHLKQTPSGWIHHPKSLTDRSLLNTL